MSSDHNGISFNINLQKSKGTDIMRTTRQYNTRKANWEEFHEKLRHLRTPNHTRKIGNTEKTEQLEQTITNYINIIASAFKHAIPTKKNSEQVALPWWSDKLERLRREVAILKNRIKRAAPVRRSKVPKRRVTAEKGRIRRRSKKSPNKQLERVLPETD